jgi:hypothetical protein
MTSRTAKNKPSRSAKEKTFSGLPKAFPASVVDFVDQDYYKDLSPEDQRWLIEFNDKHHGANFSKPGGGDWSDEQRRAAYRQKNYSNEDAYHMVKMRRDTVFLDEPPRLKDDKSGEPAEFEVPSPEGRDNAPTPSYLNTTTYKERLASFRATLDQTRSEDPPKKTPEYFKASNELFKAIDGANGFNPTIPLTTQEKEEVNHVFPLPLTRRTRK